VSPNPVILAPSILAASHANLAAGLQVVVDHGLQWLHLDIMDGHFVPNLSFGPQTVADLRALNKDLFFDTHLMLDNPHKYVEAFAKAGSQQITIHVEPEYDIGATLAHIGELGCRRGLVLNPATTAEAVLPWVEQLDMVLVMSVWPGFGGQSFIEETLGTMRQLARIREEKGLSFRIQVDGGVNLETALRCKKAGADTLVAGTAFFKAGDKHGFIRDIQS
jgi:ribulose-phosphate 3-epimerase